MATLTIIRVPLSLTDLAQYSIGGGLVKAVVDCAQGIMAVGGELHADEEQALLEAGAKQQDLWGVNLYLEKSLESSIEFDSMINVRPSQGNRSRNVEDPRMQQRIREIVSSLILA